MTWIGDATVWIRTDRAYQGDPSFNNALIALRVDAHTSFALDASRFADLSVGDHVTFGFDPRTLEPGGGSYLAGVIGRSRR